jgi:hypothetical protein
MSDLQKQFARRVQVSQLNYFDRVPSASNVDDAGKGKWDDGGDERLLEVKQPRDYDQYPGGRHDGSFDDCVHGV